MSARVYLSLLICFILPLPVDLYVETYEHGVRSITNPNLRKPDTDITVKAMLGKNSKIVVALTTQGDDIVFRFSYGESANWGDGEVKIDLKHRENGKWSETRYLATNNLNDNSPITLVIGIRDFGYQMNLNGTDLGDYFGVVDVNKIYGIGFAGNWQPPIDVYLTNPKTGESETLHLGYRKKS